MPPSEPLIISAAKSNLGEDCALTVDLFRSNNTSLRANSISVANLFLSSFGTSIGHPPFSTGPGTVTHLSFKSITPSKSVSKATPAPSTLAPAGVSNCLSQSSQTPSLSPSPFLQTSTSTFLFSKTSSL